MRRFNSFASPQILPFGLPSCHQFIVKSILCIDTGLPGGSTGKESVSNARVLGLIPGSGRSPEKGNGNPLQYSEESYGQRSLVGYSPWGQKESDRTERDRGGGYINTSITE